MSRLSIEIPEALHRAIKAQASVRGLSLREYVLRRLRINKEPAEGAAGHRFSDAGLAGIWSDRDDMQEPGQWVRKQRAPRSFKTPPDAD